MQPVCTYGALATLDHLEGCVVAFPVRFGGASAGDHALRLRFGPVGHDGAITGHVLCDIGRTCHVVHDAVLWDHALDDFVLGDVAGLDRLAELLDLTASLFGGTGRLLTGTVEVVLDLLHGLFAPGFIVIGGFGAGAIGGTGAAADQGNAYAGPIQAAYDTTYAACMAAHGEQVVQQATPTVIIQQGPILVQPAPYYVQPAPYAVVPPASAAQP